MLKTEIKQVDDLIVGLKKGHLIGFNGDCELFSQIMKNIAKTLQPKYNQFVGIMNPFYLWPNFSIFDFNTTEFARNLMDRHHYWQRKDIEEYANLPIINFKEESLYSKLEKLDSFVFWNAMPRHLCLETGKIIDDIKVLFVGRTPATQRYLKVLKEFAVKYNIPVVINVPCQNIYRSNYKSIKRITLMGGYKNHIDDLLVVRNAMNSKLYPENPYHVYYYQYQNSKTHLESFPGGKQFVRQD